MPVLFESLLDDPPSQAGASGPGLLNVDLGQNPVLHQAGREAALQGQPGQFVSQPQPQPQISAEDQARIAAAGNPLTRAGAQFNEGVSGLLGPDFGGAAETVASLSPAEDVRSLGQGLRGIGKGIVEGDGAKLFKGLQDTAFGVLGSFPGGDAAVASLKAMAGFGAAARFRKTPIETKIETDPSLQYPDIPHRTETATLPSGAQLEIFFQPNTLVRDADGLKEYDITFMIDGGMAKGGVSPRDGLPAMATVRASVNKFMQDVDPDRVTFVRAYPDLEATYNRTVKGLAEGFDGRVTKSGSSPELGRGFEVVFKDLAHPERAAQRQASSSEVVDPRGLERFPRTPSDRPLAGQQGLLPPEPGVGTQGAQGGRELDDFSILERFGSEPQLPVQEPQVLSGFQQRERDIFRETLRDLSAHNAVARERALGGEPDSLRTPAGLLETAQRRAGTEQPQFLPRHQGSVRSPSAPLGVQDLPRREGEEGQLLFPGMDLRISDQIPVSGGLLDPRTPAEIAGTISRPDPGRRVAEAAQRALHPPIRGPTGRPRPLQDPRAAFADPENPTMEEIVSGIRQLIEDSPRAPILDE